MRSSVTIDQSRRSELALREASYRDIKAAIIAFGPGSSEARLAGLSLDRLRPRGTQIRSRCTITGRGRGVLRQFRRSRIKVRELALRGDLAGVRKRSW